MNSTIEIVGLVRGDAALVRGLDTAVDEPEAWSEVTLGELRRLRTEALRAASRIRADVTKALHECEVYLSSADRILDRALIDLASAKGGSNDALTVRLDEPQASLISLAATYHRRANDKGRWANARLGRAVSLETKARRLALAIRREADSKG